MLETLSVAMAVNLQNICQHFSVYPVSLSAPASVLLGGDGAM